MAELKVIKRTGEVVGFDQERIATAISKAVRATGEPHISAVLGAGAFGNGKLHDLLTDVTTEIDDRFVELYPNVENIQDIVEKHLVKHGLYEVAKRYILYRAEHQKAREERKDKVAERSLLGKLTVVKRDGRAVLFDISEIQEAIQECTHGFDGEIDVELIARETVRNVFDGISTADIDRAVLLAASSFIERDPAYAKVAARLFLRRIYREVIGVARSHEDGYRQAFVRGIRRGVEQGLFDERLLEFNLGRLAESLDTARDDLLNFMGVQTLHERYFARAGDALLETPQAFWMRVAMGLAVLEEDRDERAVAFYQAISSLRFVPSTPTLFHSGTARPQLSSCFLTTVEDDLEHIFKSFADNAQLSKWSGGLGNDWSSIRGTGAHIKSTNVESQGVIPFLKIASDVTLAINRSGKRRGATCAYLETWHLDIEDFLDLRRNTGDERRRTHDMNTANWIPDLFMKRVAEDAEWTLFSPDETPDLHDLHGQAFEQRYAEYERKARAGLLKRTRTVSALKLWRKMLSMLFETGHPWITFKDPSNIRSPQDHAGVVHSSNLCTEITLNTSREETAVCNLGSVNLEKHVVDGVLQADSLAVTVDTAMRMLDNVIDVCFYPTPEARASNLRHRPVGLGMMGFADALFKLDIPFESEKAIAFADRSMELIARSAILGSSRLAAERGPYDSYRGSKWERGLLPQDTLDLLEAERGLPVEVERGGDLDWKPVREHVRKHGMRNSNTMAIAPTATISTISGCFPSIEPIYQNVYVKSNISGEFTVANPYLVGDLKQAGLWDREMFEQLKFHDGSVQAIDAIPAPLRSKYRTAFEVDPLHCLRMTAARSKWIDQSQSHNVFMRGTSGQALSEIYQTAWKLGLKTTYYLRTLAASQVEKSTLGSQYGFTQKRANGAAANGTPAPAEQAAAAEPQNGQDAAACNLDEDCEACQ